MNDCLDFILCENLVENRSRPDIPLIELRPGMQCNPVPRLEIIDNEPDLARREQKIRKLHYGHTYQYIKEHLLADQRNSGYLRVYFDYVDGTK